MKMKIFLTAIFSLICAQGFSQNSFGSVNYSIGFPSGDLKDFTGNTSGRGVAVDYAFMLKSNVSVGVGIGLQTFYEEKGYSSLTDGTQTFSGNQFNYVNALPIYVNGAYYFGNSPNVMPYIGVGIGTMYVNKRADIGIFEIENDGWAFLVKPEVGLQYKAASNIGLNLSYRYNYASDIDNVGSMTYSSIMIGAIWFY